MSVLKREVFFTPAFDKRNDNPKLDYGIHGVEIKWVLTGTLGAIQFLLYTGWHLPSVVEENDTKPCLVKPYGKMCLSKPQPADIGYHSYVPRFEGQTVTQNECQYLGGKPCYSDGSSLQAEDVFKILVENGDEALWKELERQYQIRLVDCD